MYKCSTQSTSWGCLSHPYLWARFVCSCGMWQSTSRCCTAVVPRARDHVRQLRAWDNGKSLLHSGEQGALCTAQWLKEVQIDSDKDNPEDREEHQNSRLLESNKNLSINYDLDSEDALINSDKPADSKSRGHYGVNSGNLLADSARSIDL